MSPQLLRAYVLIVVRDVAIPMTGLGLSVYVIASNTFQPWMIPFLISLVGVPLVGRIGQGGEEPEQREGAG